MDSAVAKAFGVLEALTRAKGPSRLVGAGGRARAAEEHGAPDPRRAVGARLRRPGRRHRSVPADAAHLGARHRRRRRPADQAGGLRGALLRLHEQTGETVSLVVRSGDDALYLDKIVSPRPLRFTTRVGSRVPLPITAGGKAILAAARRRRGRATCRSVDRSPVTDRHRHHVAIARKLSRRRGHVVLSARHRGRRRLSAAILDRDQRPAAALIVSAPTDRMTSEQRATTIELVVAAAARLGESLGRT